MRYILTGLLVAMGFLVAACGETTTERGLSGAGIGAGVGAAGAAVTGGSPITGGLIGGAVGGAAGALTEQEDIDLGDPVWDQDDDSNRD